MTEKKRKPKPVRNLFEEDPSAFRVAIAGEFSTGKSSILNLLANEPVVPVNVEYSGMPLISLTSGTEREIVAVRRNNRQPVASIGDIQDGEGPLPDRIEVTLPRKELAGLEFFEVPLHPGDTFTKTALKLVKSAGMVIWCTSANQAWKLTEATAIESIPEDILKRSVLVATRADLLSREDREKVAKRLRREAGNIFGAILFIGASREICRTAGDRAVWEASGAQALLEAVRDQAQRAGEALWKLDDEASADAAAILSEDGPSEASGAIEASAAAVAVAEVEPEPAAEVQSEPVAEAAPEGTAEAPAPEAPTDGAVAYAAPEDDETTPDLAAAAVQGDDDEVVLELTGGTDDDDETALELTADTLANDPEAEAPLELTDDMATDRDEPALELTGAVDETTLELTGAVAEVVASDAAAEDQAADESVEEVTGADTADEAAEDEATAESAADEAATDAPAVEPAEPDALAEPSPDQVEVPTETGSTADEADKPEAGDVEAFEETHEPEPLDDTAGTEAVAEQAEDAEPAAAVESAAPSDSDAARAEEAPADTEATVEVGEENEVSEAAPVTIVDEEPVAAEAAESAEETEEPDTVVDRETVEAEPVGDAGEDVAEVAPAKDAEVVDAIDVSVDVAAAADEPADAVAADEPAADEPAEDQPAEAGVEEEAAEAVEAEVVAESAAAEQAAEAVEADAATEPASIQPAPEAVATASTGSTSMREPDLAPMRDLAGLVGACLVDSDTGIMLVSEGGRSLDMEIAAAANTEVIKAQMNAMKTIGIDDTVEEMVFALGRQFHLIRPLSSNPQVFLYVILDRNKTNMALARMALKSMDAQLDLS